MPKINLAQEAVRNQVVAQRRRVLYALSIVVLCLTLGGYGVGAVLAARREDQVVAVQGQVQALDAQLAARKDDVENIMLFRERLKNLRTALASHVRWSRLFDELERVTIPVASFTRLKGEVSDRTLTSDIRVPTVDAAADLVASLQSQGANGTQFPAVLVTGVKAVAGSAGDPGTPATVVGYTVSLRMTAAPTALHLPREPAVPPPLSPEPKPDGAPSTSSFTPGV